MARARSRGGQSAVDDVRAAYDEAPYESYPHPQSAPGQLAAIAWMFGLDPLDVTGARVLEIGCAAAGNLIPFAAMHPLARTVGIDLSQVQIEQGRRRVRALGLDNVKLMHSDVAHLDLAAMGRLHIGHRPPSTRVARAENCLVSPQTSCRVRPSRRRRGPFGQRHL
jgi:SAM-dependent methyltransferase